MSDIMQKIQEYERLLDTAVPTLKQRGMDKATAEKNYKVALAKKFLELKAQGEKVTIMGELARGDETVANLKEQFIIAEILYDSVREAINVYKRQLDVLMTIYKLEWGHSK